jgi:hypothetical protein
MYLYHVRHNVTIYVMGVAIMSILLSSSVLLAYCIIFALCHNDDIITPATAPAITA